MKRAKSDFTNTEPQIIQHILDYLFDNPNKSPGVGDLLHIESGAHWANKDNFDKAIRRLITIGVLADHPTENSRYMRGPRFYEVIDAGGWLKYQRTEIAKAGLIRRQYYWFWCAAIISVISALFTGLSTSYTISKTDRAERQIKLMEQLLQERTEMPSPEAPKHLQCCPAKTEQGKTINLQDSLTKR